MTYFDKKDDETYILLGQEVTIPELIETYTRGDYPLDGYEVDLFNEYEEDIMSRLKDEAEDLGFMNPIKWLSCNINVEDMESFREHAVQYFCMYMSKIILEGMEHPILKEKEQSPYGSENFKWWAELEDKTEYDDFDPDDPLASLTDNDD